MQYNDYCLKTLLFILCMFGFMLNMQSQNISQIKSSRNYYFGEGKATTTDEAQQLAIAQLCRSISVTVYGTQVSEAKIESSNYESILKSITSARLDNLETKVLSEEPNAHVFCYVLKTDVEKMIKHREERILDLVEQGKLSEQRLQIDDALRCYYWAYLLAKSNPNPPKIKFNNNEGQATTLLPIKIKSVIQQIHAEVEEGSSEINGERISARLSFTYNDKPVSSLQYRFHDGQSFIGPVMVNNGVGEIDLVAFPSNGQVDITYETRFKDEVDPLDGDLRAAFSGGGLLTIPAGKSIPIKLKGTKVTAGKNKEEKTDIVEIAAEPARNRKTIEKKPVLDSQELNNIIGNVEAAISEGQPELAFNRFTPEGYRIFESIFKQAAKVTLVGKSNYEFIYSDGFLLGRATRIKLKFKSGKSFIENLVYRFNPQTKKIESVAFGLTKTAEDDIMNASALWPEVSRYSILNFMEDYQTAYALKRLDYIEKIFSEKALIVVGAMLKEAGPEYNLEHVIKFDNNIKNVRYSRLTKKQYLDRLKRIFEFQDYTHLKFENNVTKLIDLPSVVSKGACFGIEIKQRYTSSNYSDEGYLTLIFDTTKNPPLIYVRLWQPNKTEMMGLQDVIGIFKY